MNRDDLKEFLLEDPETGKPDHFKFQARCVRQFGPNAGLMLRYFVFLTGRSVLPDGMFYKSREEGCKETGLGHRGWDEGKKVLTGKRAWAGRTVEVLEEHRPGRRQPTHYRVDLLKLVKVFAAQVDESPHGAAQSPRGATQSPRRAAQSPYGATQSPNGAASKERQRDHRATTEETFTASSEFSSQIPVNDGRKNHQDRDDDSYNDMIGSRHSTHRKSSPREQNDETAFDDASTLKPQQESREGWLDHPLDCECLNCVAPMPKYVRSDVRVAVGGG